MFLNFLNPQSLNIGEATGQGNTETDQKYICIGIGDGPQLLKAFLASFFFSKSDRQLLLLLLLLQL
jgi:hypothetical protein